MRPRSPQRSPRRLGPLLCGRIAGVLEPGGATRLAGHLKPAFLAEVSRSLDPDRTAEIVRCLPEDLVLAVAQRLLDSGDYIVLGRFVAVVSDSVARRVVALTTGEQLLHINFYAEDRTRLDALLAHVDDERLGDVVQAAADGGQFDEGVSLLVFLGPTSQQRLGNVLSELHPSVADGVVAAAVGLGVWTELLPVLAGLSEQTLRLVVNVPTTCDPAVITGLIQQLRGSDGLVDGARQLGYLAMIVTVIDALDDEHRAVLSQVKELDDQGLRSWAADLVGVSLATADDAVAAFRSGDPLPAELVDALARADMPSRLEGERG